MSRSKRTTRTAEERARDNARVEEILAKGFVPSYDASMHTKLVGVKHENHDGTSRQDLIARVSQFDFVELVRDRLDDYDENAIEVWAEISGSRAQIGHIEAAIAAELAPAIDAGEQWRAIVTRIGGYITKGVSIFIFRPVKCTT